MAGTHFSGPVFPGVGISLPLDPSTGNRLVVGPEIGGFGFTTIQAAVNAAGRGDTIYVQPGTYDENVVVSGKDYLTIIGATHAGYARPDVQPSSGVALTVEASQGFRAVHMRFVATTAEAVLQEGNGFHFEDCVFDGNGAGTTGLLLKGNADDDSYTASEGRVVDCLFRGAATALVFDTGDAPGNGVGCTHDEVIGCRFIDNTQDIVTADSGTGTYSVQDTIIWGCYFMDKNKVNYIDLTTANGGAASDQTGMITNCFFATDSITTTNIAMVGTGFTLVGCCDTVGVQDGSGLD